MNSHITCGKPAEKWHARTRSFCVFRREEITTQKSEKPHASSCNSPMLLLLFPSNKLTLNIFFISSTGEGAGILLHIFLKVTRAVVSDGVVPACCISGCPAERATITLEPSCTAQGKLNTFCLFFCTLQQWISLVKGQACGSPGSVQALPLQEAAGAGGQGWAGRGIVAPQKPQDGP